MPWTWRSHIISKWVAQLLRLWYSKSYPNSAKIVEFWISSYSIDLLYWVMRVTSTNYLYFPTLPGIGSMQKKAYIGYCCCLLDPKQNFSYQCIIKLNDTWSFFVSNLYNFMWRKYLDYESPYIRSEHFVYVSFIQVNNVNN